MGTLKICIKFHTNPFVDKTDILVNLETLMTFLKLPVASSLKVKSKDQMEAQ